MLLERTSQACYKYMAIFGELVPSWLYSQFQAIDPISSVVGQLVSNHCSNKMLCMQIILKEETNTNDNKKKLLHQL